MSLENILSFWKIIYNNLRSGCLSKVSDFSLFFVNIVLSGREEIEIWGGGQFGDGCCDFAV